MRASITTPKNVKKKLHELMKRRVLRGFRTIEISDNHIEYYKKHLINYAQDKAS